MQQASPSRVTGVGNVLKGRRSGGGGSSQRNHIETYAYDDNTGISYIGGTTATPAQVRQWVTYAETLQGDKIFTDQSAGAPVALCYLDVNKIYVSGFPNDNFNSDSIPMVSAALPETAWLHTAGTSATKANRIRGPVRGDGTYAIYPNLHDASGVAWIVNYLQTTTVNGGAHTYEDYDGFFLDDWAYVLGSQGLLNGVSGSPSTALEYTSDANMRAAQSNFLSNLKRAGGSFWTKNALNTMGNGNVFVPTGMAWAGTTNIVGLIGEGLPFDTGSFAGDGFMGNTYYAFMLDQMANVVKNFTGCWYCFRQGSWSTDQQRRVGIATALLGYEPDRVTMWGDLGTSTLSINPEQGLWPDTSTALTSMAAPVGADFATGSGASASSGGHKSLQVTTDVYVREFATAYNQGTPIGKLAVIVNATGATVTVPASGWLTQTYGHSVTWSGGAVQAGGSIALTGAFTAGTTTIAAHDALILVA